jgi:CRISPR-associated protein Csm2
MTNQTHQNQWGSYQRPYGQGDGRQQQSNRNKTFNELAGEVRNEYFRSGLYDEILKMGSTNKLDALFEEMERFVKELGTFVTTSQIRNVYAKAIMAKNCNDLKMIRPQLAYIAGRAQNDKNDAQKKFLAFLDDIIKSVQKEEQREEFNAFFEAIVAYHKFYGKNN